MSTDLLAIQQQLMAYLLDQDDAIAQRILQQGDVSTETRLGIYHNAYRARLRETIDVDHPVLGSYLGDDLFDQMVAGYIEKYPSSFTSLRQFCDRLADFLEQVPPFADHPQLSELARFERLLLAAFDAADMPAMPADSLAQIPAQEWPQLRIRFHPSVQLFLSRWNVVEMWQAIKAGRSPPAPENGDFSWLVWRNEERLTEFCSLAATDLSLVEASLRGQDFASLCELLLTEVEETEVAPTLVASVSRWLDQGLICGLGQGGLSP